MQQISRSQLRRWKLRWPRRWGGVLLGVISVHLSFKSARQIKLFQWNNKAQVIHRVGDCRFVDLSRQMQSCWLRPGVGAFHSLFEDVSRHICPCSHSCLFLLTPQLSFLQLTLVLDGTCQSSKKLMYDITMSLYSSRLLVAVLKSQAWKTFIASLFNFLFLSLYIPYHRFTEFYQSITQF